MDARDPQTYAIIGTGMEVHRELGSGLLEPAYQQSFAVELGLRNIPFSREVGFEINYKGHILDCSYRADFVCFGEVIVELKAAEALLPKHRAQVINYLKIGKLQRAVLINFGNDELEYERIVLNYSGS